MVRLIRRLPLGMKLWCLTDRPGLNNFVSRQGPFMASSVNTGSPWQCFHTVFTFTPFNCKQGVAWPVSLLGSTHFLSASLYNGKWTKRTLTAFKKSKDHPQTHCHRTWSREIFTITTTYYIFMFPGLFCWSLLLFYVLPQCNQSSVSWIHTRHMNNHGMGIGERVERGLLVSLWTQADFCFWEINSTVVHMTINAHVSWFAERDNLKQHILKRVWYPT